MITGLLGAAGPAFARYARPVRLAPSSFTETHVAPKREVPVFREPSPGAFGAIVGAVVGATAGGALSYALCEADGCETRDVVLTIGAFTGVGALLGAVMDVVCCRDHGKRRLGRR